MTGVYEQKEAMDDFETSMEDTDLDAEENVLEDEPTTVPLKTNSFEPLQIELMAVLIEKVMHQDELALSTLYQRLSGPVFSLALQITRNSATAEEVLQDVFWQVWRQAPRFDKTRGTVPAWVLTIARSRALDAARKCIRTQKSLPQDFEESNNCVSSTAPGPQDLLLAAQQGSRLKATLETLDPVRQKLVSLYFYQGLTHQEISDLTGIPLGSVKSHLRRSLSILRDELGVNVAFDLS